MAVYFEGEPAKSFEFNKTVTLKIEPTGAKVVQEGSDRPGILMQEISVDFRDMMATYRSVIPAPVALDLSAVEPYVRQAFGLRKDDPLPAVETVRVEMVDNGKTGDEARSAEVLTVNGVYVPLPGQMRDQPISRRVGCMTGLLHSMARDARVSVEDVEKMMEYVYLSHATVHAMIATAFNTVIELARDKRQDGIDVKKLVKELNEKTKQRLGELLPNGGAGDGSGTTGDGG